MSRHREVYRQHGSRERRTSSSPYRRDRRDSSSGRRVDFANNHLESAQADDEYILEGKIDGVPGTITALLDSGSDVNVMSSHYFEKNIAPLHILHSTGQKAVSFNGSASAVLGEYKSEVIFDKTCSTSRLPSCQGHQVRRDARATVHRPTRRVDQYARRHDQAERRELHRHRPQERRAFQLSVTRV